MGDAPFAAHNGTFGEYPETFGESPETFLGIHVRMTDRQPRQSLEHLSKKIERLNLSPSQIFLATDNAEVEDYFAATHKNVVFMPKWRPQYDTGQQAGIHHYAALSDDYSKVETVLKESIVDMWLLSKCEYLIFQKNSRFSRMSAILKNQPAKTFSW
ncbi:hypothetical protein FACS189430_10940 [Bacteroidia bacterium]|nr:hypothetical protein FACS189430_10940 [Bacteroidia bacterium]